MDTLTLEVYTPEKVVLNEEVQQVQLQGEKGRLGILPEHTSLIAKLSFGALEYTNAQGSQQILCGAGVVEVLDDRVLVLVDTAERSDEIDRNRAEEAKKRAEDRIKKSDPNLDVDRASVALQRAIQRIHFYSDQSS